MIEYLSDLIRHFEACEGVQFHITVHIMFSKTICPLYLPIKSNILLPLPQYSVCTSGIYMTRVLNRFAVQIDREPQAVGACGMRRAPRPLARVAT